MHDENMNIKHKARTSLAAHNQEGMGPCRNTNLTLTYISLLITTAHVFLRWSQRNASQRNI